MSHLVGTDGLDGRGELALLDLLIPGHDQLVKCLTILHEGDIVDTFAGLNCYRLRDVADVADDDTLDTHGYLE